MKDRLRDFVNKHRDEFDNREPSEGVWSEIERAAFHDMPRKRWMTAVSIWRAAAIVFFGLSVYLFVAPKERHEVSSLQTELKDIESFYGDQIAEKVAFIDKLDGYEDDRFTQDLKKLDAMYEVLREEMKASPSAKVKDALILNMLIRIDLLNQQIQRLEDYRKTDNSRQAI
jgi:hypothetical protein